MRRCGWIGWAAVAVGVIGCSKREPPAGSVAFQVATRHPPGVPLAAPEATTAAAGALATGDSVVVTLGRDTVILRRVELVLTQIMLSPMESGHCDPDDPNECSTVEAGPVLLQLPLGDQAEHRTTVRAPADRYIVLHLQIHRPDAQRDSAFLAAHPEFANTSVRVQGTFSRAGRRREFVFATDFNEQEETDITPPMIVAADSTARLTLRLNVATWFLSAEKTALVDPATAGPGQPHEHLVKDNIRMSVRTFEDVNSDGLDDPAPADQ
ncbi:MAG: hypothetical protein ACREMF_00625 [Gemmatimonadales bacterium]